MMNDLFRETELMMTLFDAPSRESSCVKRSRTSTPTQSLALLNEKQRVEMGRMNPGLVHNGISWPNPVGASMRQVVSIESPAQFCLVGDGASADLTTEWGSGGAAYWGHNFIRQFLGFFTRHNGGMNLTFADGHVDWFSAEEMDLFFEDA